MAVKMEREPIFPEIIPHQAQSGGPPKVSQRRSSGNASVRFSTGRNPSCHPNSSDIIALQALNSITDDVNNIE